MVALTASGRPITCDGCSRPFADEDEVEAALAVPAPAYIYGPGVVYLVCPAAPATEPSACLRAARAVDDAWWLRFGCGDTACRGECLDGGQPPRLEPWQITRALALFAPKHRRPG